MKEVWPIVTSTGIPRSSRLKLTQFTRFEDQLASAQGNSSLEGTRVPTVAPLQSLPFLAIVSTFILITIGFLLSGCAIYYRDRDTGAEHIFGFGHLSVKTIPPKEGKQALVQRTTLTGIAAGLDNGSLGMSAGWDRREHILIYDENVAVTIQRPPSNDFFYFKIGTYPPEFEATPNTDNSGKKKEHHR